jgi:hypothetical protein
MREKPRPLAPDRMRQQDLSRQPRHADACILEKLLTLKQRRAYIHVDVAHALACCVEIHLDIFVGQRSCRLPKNCFSSR